MSLEKEIQEAINKNLTAEVGSRLKELLVQAEQDREQLVDLLEKNRLLEEKTKEMSSELRSISSRESSVASREIAVKAKENEILKLEVKYECEKEKRDLVICMFNTVFQNRTVRESAYATKPIIDQNGNNTYNTASESSDKTVVET